MNSSYERLDRRDSAGTIIAPYICHALYHTKRRVSHIYHGF